MIVCHDEISVGKNCSFGPNVMLFDHDYDYKDVDGKKPGKYKTSPIRIGNNVWIGANTIILRGTIIGDKCVIGAGSVIKGNYEANSLIVQKNEINIVQYKSN